MTYYKYFLKSIKSFKWYNVSYVPVIQYVTFLSFCLCRTYGQIPLTPVQESKKGLFCMFTNQTCCEQIFFSSLSPHPSYFFGPMMGLNKAYQWIVRNVFVDMACILNTVGNKNSKNLVWMGIRIISNIYLLATIYYNSKVLLHSDALIYKTQNNFCKDRCKAFRCLIRFIIRWY